MRIHLAEALEARDIYLRVRVITAQLGRDTVALLVGEGNARGLAARELIKRRNGGIYIALLDERAHEAEEEGQHQGADVRTVDVGIGHDDYLVVSELIDVKLVADARAQRGYDGCKLIVAVDLVRARLFDVEHLAPQGEDGLEARVATLGRRAACRVALDDVQLCKRRVALVAVAQLVRHLTGLQPRFSAHGFARLSRCLAGAGGGHRLVEYRLADGGVFFQKLLELIADDIVDERAHLAVAELCLGLTLELRLGELDGDYRGHALAAVLAGELVVVFEYADLCAVGV